MSVLNFLKEIKLPSFEDEFIVDPADQVSPENERQMRVLAAMRREKETRQSYVLDNCSLWDEDDADATLPGTSAYFIEHSLHNS